MSVLSFVLLVPTVSDCNNPDPLTLGHYPASLAICKCCMPRLLFFSAHSFCTAAYFGCRLRIYL
jgi:hypothetical protein